MKASARIDEILTRFTTRPAQSQDTCWSSLYLGITTLLPFLGQKYAFASAAVLAWQAVANTQLQRLLVSSLLRAPTALKVTKVQTASRTLVTS